MLLLALVTLAIAAGDVELKIMGGVMVTWEAAYEFVVDYQRACTASLLTKDWILTAAHCEMQAGSWVSFSRWDIEDAFEVGAQRRKIDYCIAHTGFNQTDSEHDIAVCKLDAPANPGTMTVRLPTDEEDSTFAQTRAQPFTGSGWGTTSYTGPLSRYQKSVNLPLVLNAECQKRNYWRTVRDTNMCAGFDEGGHDMCKFDDGGPLFLYIQDGDAEAIPVQFGIMSWGYRCGEPMFPGVYTRVAAYRDWLYIFIPELQPGFQTLSPSHGPSIAPSLSPSSAPTNQPTNQPTNPPTIEPTTEPTSQPTRQPTTQPTAQPAVQPTQDPKDAFSCRNKCGMQAPSGCYCDEICHSSSDCCDDVATMCGFLIPLPPTSLATPAPTTGPTRQPTTQPSTMVPRPALDLDAEYKQQCRCLGSLPMRSLELILSLLSRPQLMAGPVCYQGAEFASVCRAYCAFPAMRLRSWSQPPCESFSPVTSPTTTEPSPPPTWRVTPRPSQQPTRAPVQAVTLEAVCPCFLQLPGLLELRSRFSDAQLQQGPVCARTASFPYLCAALCELPELGLDEWRAGPCASESCVGQCDVKAATGGKCYCDVSCLGFGDCCLDLSVCYGQSTSRPTSQITESPTITTESPTITTGSPTITTGSPTIKTGSPTITTGSPTITTGSPTQTTRSPTQTTGSPTWSKPSCLQAGCQGRGVWANGTKADCFCDWNCAFSGDCCEGHAEECPPQGSCAGQCGVFHGNGCVCQPDCTDLGVCCSDLEGTCPP